MTTVNLSTIVDAIAVTLGAAAGVRRTQSYDELTEGVQDMPLLQVYPQSGSTSEGRENDRITFGNSSGQEHRKRGFYTIHADLYARQRSHIGEDMGKLVPMITAIETVLEAQRGPLYFGLPDNSIQSFRWRWERVIFVYGDNEIKYYGARFYIDVWTF